MFDFLSIPAEEAAPRLLGCILERTLEDTIVRVRIVETEAYHENDEASHSYKNRSKRTDIMFGPAGYLYVYFTYGMHYCANVVVGKENEGSAVLIRAVEPIDGEGILETYRPNARGVNLINGPAKLCQALNINKALNTHDLSKAPLKLIKQNPLKADQIVQTTRIGITKAVNQPWRFYIKDNPYVSRV